MWTRRGGIVAACLVIVTGCGLDTRSAGVRVVPPSTTIVTAQSATGPGDDAIATSNDTDDTDDRVDDGRNDEQTDTPIGSASDGLLPSSVAVVGDSLTLSAVEELGPALTGLGLDVIAIDGVKNRRMVSRTSTVSSGSDAIAAIMATESPDLWVIALGTNDVGAQQGISDMGRDMRTVLNLIPDDVPVVWVDLWIRDQPYQIVDGNRLIRAIIATRQGSGVVDWYAHGQFDDGVITDDGVHLTQSGQRRFADSIVSTIDTLFRN